MSDPSGRAALRAQLQQLGVETVTAEYDGYGDSGQVGDPNFGSADVPDGLGAAVQDLFYELLEEHYAGWEINEGSFGEFVWDVTADAIQLVHNTRMESYETEEQSL